MVVLSILKHPLHSLCVHILTNLFHTIGTFPFKKQQLYIYAPITLNNKHTLSINTGSCSNKMTNRCNHLLMVMMFANSVHVNWGYVVNYLRYLCINQSWFLVYECTLNVCDVLPLIRASSENSRTPLPSQAILHICWSSHRWASAETKSIPVSSGSEAFHLCLHGCATSAMCDTRQG